METENNNNTTPNVKSSNKLKTKCIPDMTVNDVNEFWDKVEINEKTGCWEWAHSVDTKGAAYFKINGTRYYAHRLAYVMSYGTIADDHEIHRKCKNLKCIRIDHLTIVNPLDGPKYKPRHKINKARKPNPIPELSEKDIERFKSYIDISSPDSCWEWQKFINPSGYGTISILGKSYPAHRVAYTVFNGPIPEGKLILHTCDNRSCCNGFHLYAGDYTDNAIDIVKRNRRPKYERYDFWDKVDKRGPMDCWPWLGPKTNSPGSDRKAYGRAGNGETAHRYAYKLVHGEIPEGMVVRHICDRMDCINVSHMELGTHAENMTDLIRNAENNKAFKLNLEKADEIRKLYAGGMKVPDIAKQFNIVRSCIYEILSYSNWYDPESDTPKTPLITTHKQVPFETVQEIRRLYESGAHTRDELAELYGLPLGTIVSFVYYNSRKYK